jgi:glycosyltransferase involved in cell wall biosynthesis
MPDRLSEVSHTFVVPAFGEPRWLSRCLESLKRQTVASPIFISTSTPNLFLTGLAEAHGVEIAIHEGRGIAADWNFALSLSSSRWTTLAHQDDWYDEHYTERCLRATAGVDDVLIVFTDAAERLHGHGKGGINQTAKRVLCRLAFGSSSVIRSTMRKRLLLAFGNPIPCPAVTYHRNALIRFTFAEGWKSNLDWVAWLELAKSDGAFVYVSEPLVHRTLHKEAATSTHIKDRRLEDPRVLQHLWPRPLSDVMAWCYGASRLQYRGLSNRPSRR